MDGLVVVDKPAGWTSHDVVGRCRRIFGQKRVGHSGTLDPDATGVLLVGLGRVTRLLRFLNDLPKTYTGEIVLGVATTTLDAAGEVTGEWEMSPSLDELRAAAASLTGDIMQVPPMVSAVQIGGKRLHELARQGIEVERAPRPVTVYRFDVLGAGAGAGNVVPIEVECSTGTYVRVLAADLGAALGGGAHLRNLRRTRIGPFDAPVPLDAAAGHVLTPAQALPHLPAVTVDADTAVAIGHGKRVDVGAGDEPTAVLGPDGDLLAVFEHAKPAVVLV